MKPVFIIANWKANMTTSQAKEWLVKANSNWPIASSHKEIILCPPFSLLSFFKEKIADMPLSLGSQDVSRFSQGAYTGELPAQLLQEFVTYCIIGHSERRRYLNETEEVIAKKIEQAVLNGLTPIVCISEVSQVVNSKWTLSHSKLLIAYEPLSAIGSGNPDSPENANMIAAAIKKELGDIPVLYGGSVTADNVDQFTKEESIDGVLVGGASLNPHAFTTIIQKA